jgi:hypothetical protein
MDKKTATLSELRLIIMDTEKELNDKLYNLQGNSTIAKIKELNGHEEILSRDYDFDKELEDTIEITDRLAELRANLALANNTTKIDDTDSIQSAISKLQEKRKLLNKIEFILNTSKEKKQRKSDGGFSNGSPAYYEEISLNFDSEELKKFRDSLKEELNILEVKIQEANNSTTIKI